MTYLPLRSFISVSGINMVSGHFASAASCYFEIVNRKWTYCWCKRRYIVMHLLYDLKLSITKKYEGTVVPCFNHCAHYSCEGCSYYVSGHLATVDLTQLKALTQGVRFFDLIFFPMRWYLFDRRVTIGKVQYSSRDSLWIDLNDTFTRQWSYRDMQSTLCKPNMPHKWKER